MSYLKDFQTHISNHDYSNFLRLWEEYCSGDEVEADELREILRAVKASDISDPFGRHVDRILPLWQKLPDSEISYGILKLIIDIQTTNNDVFFQLAFDALKKRYSEHKHFNEKIRLIGLRNKEKFQGAISNYELLSHMEKGNFVFHTGGWGVGEIVDVSLIREQLSLEFDYVPGKKDMSFSNAFKTLIPIPNDHFLAMRFGDPDALEKKAKEESVEVIRILLRDLGPRTAADIKNELCELVIPANEWTRWWQMARAKIKKDTMIETPEELKYPFRLRKSEVTHEERLQKVLENKPNADTLIQMVYSFTKDFPETLKNAAFKSQLSGKISEMLSFEEVSDSQELQILFLLQDLGTDKETSAISDLIRHFKDVPELLAGINVIAFKKRALVEIRKNRPDWKDVFFEMFFRAEQNPLRDYILHELSSAKCDEDLKKKLEELASAPHRYPDTFLWYFQKLMGQNNPPYADGLGKTRFFESFLILLSKLEQDLEHRDLVKKMHGLLSDGRYAIVRQIMQDAKADDVKEFLLLSTKCRSLSDHDIKILHSLAEVAHPSLGKQRKKNEGPSADTQVIWTTQEGYLKLQQRIQQVATVETVENAKEIEIARAHGDLRENAEFKAALEKRDRLQSELKFLSDQLNRSRVLTKADISKDEVGVGCIVECKNNGGQKVTFTLLGPWDADTDKNILSFQSKLAQTMKGLKAGSKFQFQDTEYSITSIRSYL
ncbi:MAG TPA: GreA/GreB family elongation factor [Rhabdochlamydiaceae bacterium]|nr:GreA/GreB family elongation factor [Rhabdochlamydiaceae bacterium]